MPPLILPYLIHQIQYIWTTLFWIVFLSFQTKLSVHWRWEGEARMLRGNDTGSKSLSPQTLPAPNGTLSSDQHQHGYMKQTGSKPTTLEASPRTRLRRWYITIPLSDQWCTTIENHRYQWLSYSKTIGKPLIPMVALNHSIQWWW